MNKKMITVCGTQLDAYDMGYDTNGNRRWVVWHGCLATMINNRIGNPDIDPLMRTDTNYRHALAAVARIGGKRFHNKKFGGGIVFAGYEVSKLGDDLTECVDVYSRWYNSESVAATIVEQVARRVRCRLPILVKTTNSGISVSGSYANHCKLKIRVDYDHNVTSTDNYTKAALLWLAKAEYKRFQLNGQVSHCKLLNDYTALDANTRVFMYEIQGY